MDQASQLGKLLVPQTRFGSYFQKGKVFRSGLSKMEDLPKQEKKKI